MLRSIEAVRSLFVEKRSQYNQFKRMIHFTVIQSVDKEP